MAVVLAVAVSACGSLSDRREDVGETVARFEEALDSGRHAYTCAALAPRTREEVEQSAGSRCEQAVGEQQLLSGGGLRQVDVYGDQARAVLAEDTLFLSRFPTGWKVTAAGCAERPKQPYQCEIKGG